MGDNQGLYPALLKHWRNQNGLSQLDLALASDVSARHISFLETGRSTPSQEMVLVLGHTLGVPLRHLNVMLRAAGHEPRFDDEPTIPDDVTEVLTLLKAHHEPYPLMIVDRLYTLRDLNDGADLLMTALLGERTGEINLARLLFDPAGAQPLIANFEQVGRTFLWRIHREVLADPDDRELRGLFDGLLAMPTVDPDWKKLDLSVVSEPVLGIHLRYEDLELRFLTMITAFQAPQNVLMEDLRIETWLPADAATRQFYDSMAQLSA